MSRLIAVLWLSWVCALLGCGTETEIAPTAIRVRTEMSPSFGLTELGFVSGENEATYPDAPAVLDPVETVTILVADVAAEEAMHIDVWGLSKHERIAHGDVDVKPELHATVDAEVTLAHLPCGAWCTTGATSCALDGVRTCEQRDTDPCLEWSESIACPAEAPFCSLGRCAAGCIDECAEGDARCAGPTGIERCGKTDSDTCFDWGPLEPCAEGEVCEAGACRKPVACTDDCKLGETRCANDGFLECGQFDTDDCLDWSPPRPCPGGQSCSNGQCSNECVDECSQSACSGLVFEHCGQFDSDACSDLSSGASCAPANACEEGACDPQGGCSQAPLVCEMPPENTCVNDHTLKVFATAGMCSEGTCDYSSTTVACPNCPDCPVEHDTWKPTNQTGAPAPRSRHTAIWTGKEMIVWGGEDGNGEVATGGRYDPVADKWKALPTNGAPSPRSRHTAIWTGQEMVIWGGHAGQPGAPIGSGARYDPVTDKWTALPTAGAPSARSNLTAVWTGTEVLYWGGQDAVSSGLATGARYDPSSNAWKPLSTSGSPAPRSDHVAAWTGTQLLVWGGQYQAFLSTGDRLDLSGGSWTPLPTSGALSRRFEHTAVWTGSKMIVWGGFSDLSGLSPDGRRYDPTMNEWAAMTEVGAPEGRHHHTAVWSGSDMLIWGGSADGTTGALGTGGRYAPTADEWSPIADDDRRYFHTAVWTGAEMIVWGGFDGASHVVATGARYTP